MELTVRNAKFFCKHYKEFVDLYFDELVTALDTYLNPFITGKDWEETPFDWTEIK